MGFCAGPAPLRVLCSSQSRKKSPWSYLAGKQDPGNSLGAVFNNGLWQEVAVGFLSQRDSFSRSPDVLTGRSQRSRVGSGRTPRSARLAPEGQSEESAEVTGTTLGYSRPHCLLCVLGLSLQHPLEEGTAAQPALAGHCEQKCPRWHLECCVTASLEP